MPTTLPNLPNLAGTNVTPNVPAHVLSDTDITIVNSSTTPGIGADRKVTLGELKSSIVTPITNPIAETVSAITSGVGGLTTRVGDLESFQAKVITRVGDLESFQAKVIANSFSKAIPGTGPFQPGITRPILSEALSFPSKGLWEIGMHLTFRADWVGQNAGEVDHETWMLALLHKRGGDQVGRGINGLRVSMASTNGTSAYFTKYSASAGNIGDTELEYGLGLHITVPVPGDSNHTLSLQGGEFICRKIAD